MTNEFAATLLEQVTVLDDAEMRTAHAMGAYALRGIVWDISYEERKAIYVDALAKWGREAQSRQAIEEMSELTKEICKACRGSKNRQAMAEEIADVLIMMEQLRLMYNLDKEVDCYMDAKVRRLQRRVRGEQDG